MFTKPKPISPSFRNALLSETKAHSPTGGSRSRDFAAIPRKRLRFKLESARGELVVPHGFKPPRRKRLQVCSTNESPAGHPHVAMGIDGSIRVGAGAKTFAASRCSDRQDRVVGPDQSAARENSVAPANRVLRDVEARTQQSSNSRCKAASPSADRVVAGSTS